MRFSFVLVIALTVAASALNAQEADKSDPRKRMVFPAAATEPAPTPVPAATPSPKTDSPLATINAFFLALKSGLVDAAYDALARGTVISERKENVLQLKARTTQALDSYGPISGFEVIGTLEAGKNLTRYTCISLNTDLPLRWRFYFYRGPDGWKLVDLRVDDGLVELFEEVAREQAK
jgi:hypothetical protein